MSLCRRSALVSLALFMIATVGACRVTRTYAVVPKPSGGYKPDTLRAFQNGKEVFVIFRFDTITHTQTLYRTDTLWKEGKQIIRDTVRVVRRDTVRLTRVDTVRLNNVGIATFDPNKRPAQAPPPRRDTVRITRVDTVRVVKTDTMRIPFPVPRGDTVRLRDTVYLPTQTPTQNPGQQRRVDTIRVAGPMRVDTVRVAGPTRVDTVRVAGPARVDTVRITRTDTVRVATGNGRVDTVRVVRVDTVRIASGSTTVPGRSVRIPPGQMPPAGQCRLWIVGKPPGQQAAPVSCERVGGIPAGAFVLLNDQAWDMDVNWAAEARKGLAVPAQILALKR